MKARQFRHDLRKSRFGRLEDAGGGTYAKASARGGVPLPTWPAALLLALQMTAPAQAGGPDYRLGPDDRLRLKVYEWRASQDEIYEWKALGAEYSVAADGMLAIPLIGQVAAGGKLPTEVAKEIGQGLRRNMGLMIEPSVSLEIVEFRPFFITGEVAKPGAYPYKPGLTVLQGVAIAGGLQRPTDVGLLRLSRDAIAAEGDLELFSHEATVLAGRRARLQAEIDGAENVEFPEELTSRQQERSIALLMEQERLIFRARLDAFRTQSSALAQLKEFLEKETVSLSGQVSTQDTQMALVRKELDSVSTLVEKGFAVAPRQLGLERAIAQIQGDRLRLETELMRVRQESSRTDISLIELRNTRMNELTKELRECQAQIEQIAQKANISEKLLYEAEVLAPRQLRDNADSRRLEPVYTLIRTVDGVRQEHPAAETDLMLPGDTLKVDPTPQKARSFTASQISSPDLSQPVR